MSMKGKIIKLFGGRDDRQDKPKGGAIVGPLGRIGSSRLFTHDDVLVLDAEGRLTDGGRALGWRYEGE